MNSLKNKITMLSGAALLAPSIGTAAWAGVPESFTPLTSPHTPPGSNLVQPFKLPAGFIQTFITDRVDLGFDGTTGTGGTRLNGNWDMIAFDPTGENIFIPFETGSGSGIGRYNRATGVFTQGALGNDSNTFEADPTLWSSDRALDGTDDFGAVDPAEWTPNGTLLWAEEWSGTGRIFEWTNPLTSDGTTTGTSQRWLSTVPSVAHEGLKFDSAGTLYFIDERNDGSIFKYVPTNPADLAAGGQTFVLVDDDFIADGGKPEENWNSTDNSGTDRAGTASWVAMTNADGTAGAPGLIANPFDYGTSGSRGGQLAADELNGTPYGRPEDLEIGQLSDGTEVLYFATTSENIVYSINLDPNGDGVNSEVHVMEFVNSAVTPDTLGNDPVGSGNTAADDGPDDEKYGLDDPDNLAIGPNGEIYIIEDEDPGDIWVAFDADDDGVAESVALWAALGEDGAEPTGFKLDPADPSGSTFLVAIQHPGTGNDALWAITVPEPASAALFTIGSSLLMLHRRNKA